MHEEQNRQFVHMDNLARQAIEVKMTYQNKTDNDLIRDTQLRLDGRYQV